MMKSLEFYIKAYNSCIEPEIIESIYKVLIFNDADDSMMTRCINALRRNYISTTEKFKSIEDFAMYRNVGRVAATYLKAAMEYMSENYEDVPHIPCVSHIPKYCPSCGERNLSPIYKYCPMCSAELLIEGVDNGRITVGGLRRALYGLSDDLPIIFVHDGLWPDEGQNECISQIGTVSSVDEDGGADAIVLTCSDKNLETLCSEFSNSTHVLIKA